MIKGVLSEEKIVEVLSDDIVTDDMLWECFIQEQDPLLRFDSRSANQLIDSVSGETATILIPEFFSQSREKFIGDKTKDIEKFFNGDNHSLFFRAKYMSAFSGVKYLFWAGTTGRYLYVAHYYNYIRISFGDGTNTHTVTIIENTSVEALDYYDILITIDTSEVNSYIYDPDGNILAHNVKDVSEWIFNDDENSLSFTVGDTNTHYVLTLFKKYSAVKTLAQCRNHENYDDLDIYIPTFISGGLDISNNDNHLYSDRGISSDCISYQKMNYLSLDYGFATYHDSGVTGYYNKYIIYDKDGNFPEIDLTSPSPLSGFRPLNKKYGSLTQLTHIDCKIRFTNVFFDRSDSVIWNDDCRAADYYDAVNTKDFHISELNQRTLLSWLNVGYKGRLYIKFSDNSINEFNRTILEEIFVFNEDKTGVVQENMLRYTNDIFAAIIDGDDCDYDENGYVQLGVLNTIKPMLLLRIDDGDISAYDNWKPFLDGFGATAILGIHAAEMGTVGGYDYMTWEQCKELQDAGWVIADHNNYNQNYNDPAYQNYDYIPAQFIAAQAAAVENGIVLNHYVANHFSPENKGLQSLVSDAGYLSCLLWNGSDAGWQDPDGANYQALDLYRISCLACDLAGDYNIVDSPNTEEIAAIKSEIDTAIANNSLIVLFWHTYSGLKAIALTEVLNYAIAQGIDFVTMDEVIENTAYL